MNRIRLSFIVLVLFVLVSCDSKPHRIAPTVLLSESQMIDVLMDVQLIEATISYRKSVHQTTGYIKNIGFDTLFSHYGITDSIFKENMKYYYSVDPETLIRIVDSVESRLLKLKN